MGDLLDLNRIENDVFAPFIVKNGKVVNYNDPNGIEFGDNERIDTTSLPETYMINIDDLNNNGSLTSIELIELIKQGYILYSIAGYNTYLGINSGSGDVNLNKFAPNSPTTFMFAYYDDSPGGSSKPYVYFAPIYPEDNYFGDSSSYRSITYDDNQHAIPDILNYKFLFGIDSIGNIFATFPMSSNSGPSVS